MSTAHENRPRRTRVRDEKIPGPHGQLTLRVYEPEGTPRAGFVWVHGGAFLFGDLDMPESDWVARQLVADGIAVVCVGYQLAPVPETAAQWGQPRPGVHFPVASEEVGAAFRWATTTSQILDAGKRWSLGGASAGANLAVGAALRIRDTTPTEQPSSLVLACPLIHARLPEMSGELAAKSAALPADARFEPESVEQIGLNYVGDESQLTNPYAFPDEADVEGLPPTFIVNSENDSLRASGQEFAAQLARSGVNLTVLYEPGTRHGHLNSPDDPAAHATIERMRGWIE